MRFLSPRDLGNPSRFLRELAQQKDLVLTADGKPIAMLLRVEAGDLEKTVRAVRQVWAQRAVSRIRRKRLGAPVKEITIGHRRCNSRSSFQNENGSEKSESIPKVIQARRAIARSAIVRRPVSWPNLTRLD
jgi:hypothetical protein